MRFTPDIERRLIEFVGQEDLEAYFEFDIRFLGYVSDQEVADFSKYHDDIPEGAVISPWGCGSVKGSFMHFTRPIDVPMRNLTVSDLGDYPWPRFEPNMDEMRKRVGEIHALSCAAVSAYESGSYEQACHVRGREEFLMDLAADVEFAETLLTRISEIKARKAMASAEAGVDVVWIGDDLGAQRSLIFSPDTWRRLIRPPLQHIVDGIRSVRDDVIIAYHSCGHVEPLVGELADVGIDVLESVQPEANDVEKLKTLHGDRLAFWGTLGAQSTFSHGSPEDVRREVRQRIATVGKGGGLLLAPAHRLEPEVSVENVLAFVDEVKNCER